MNQKQILKGLADYSFTCNSGNILLNDTFSEKPIKLEVVGNFLSIDTISDIAHELSYKDRSDDLHELVLEIHKFLGLSNFEEKNPAKNSLFDNNSPLHEFIKRSYTIAVIPLDKIKNIDVKYIKGKLYEVTINDLIFKYKKDYGKNISSE